MAGGGGLVFTPGRYPGRAPLDAYGNGGFRFAGMSHVGSLLLLPSGIRAWQPPPLAEWTVESFAHVFAEADAIDVLLIGCGVDLAPLGKVLRAAFRDAGIVAEPMSTGAAARTFNVLLAEDRAVAAALVAVD